MGRPGMRVFEDPHFHPDEPEQIRSLYRRHMTGNSLYRNVGDGKFENVGVKSGVEMGRWSWSTDAWDFDNDGFADLYVANGYISGLETRDVSSFFWRQVVAKSPRDASPSPDYERGWGAMNELIRSDSTWNGHERNVFLANNRDGTFSDISGVVWIGFSRRQPGICARRSRRRRQIGNNAQEPECTAGSNLAARDE